MVSEAFFTLERPVPVETLELPVVSEILADGTLFLDFGRAMFGTLELTSINESPGARVNVVLGEALDSRGRVDTSPPGCIRSLEISHNLELGPAASRLTIPPLKGNTCPASIPMPQAIGEVCPFRYVEISGNGTSDISKSARIAVHIPFDEDAADFYSSDDTLNAVWELCKHSIKATSFCGVYIDGDRERIPYEGDAYINQLGHYALDTHSDMGRYTWEYLCRYPTWPTEWQMHTVMMAWTDYMYTGDRTALKLFYPDLKVKTLMDLARNDGLISTESVSCNRAFEEKLHLHHPRYPFSHGLEDLVDWPPGSFTEGGVGERDNHEMLPINTVVNAFHVHTLFLMQKVAEVLEYHDDSVLFREKAERARDTINRILLDTDRGVYLDGEGSRHSSLHSNMLMLAFGLVPEGWKKPVLDYIISRGMACSVYGAQFLLEALYMNGAAEEALALMNARHDRSWWNMIRSGSTITTEAWDWRYKNNQDWNHAWGAVPSNIISRYLLGVRPLEPGFSRVIVCPQPGSLDTVSGLVPTIKGTIQIDIWQEADRKFKMNIRIPSGMKAKICIPFTLEIISRVTIDGRPVEPAGAGTYSILGDFYAGQYMIEAELDSTGTITHRKKEDI